MKDILSRDPRGPARVITRDPADDRCAEVSALLDRIHPLSRRKALLQQLLEETVERERSSTMAAFRVRAEAEALAQHAAALAGLAAGTRTAPFASVFCTDDDGLPEGVSRTTVAVEVPNLIVLDEDAGTLGIYTEVMGGDEVVLKDGQKVPLTPEMLTHLYLSHDCDWYSSTGCYAFNSGHEDGPHHEDNSAGNYHMSQGYYTGDLYVYHGSS